MGNSSCWRQQRLLDMVHMDQVMFAIGGRLGESWRRLKGVIEADYKRTLEPRKCPTCNSDDPGELLGECADRATRYQNGWADGGRGVRVRNADHWHLKS